MTTGVDRRRLLLTGGTGSIGPTLVPELLRAGWEVLLVGRQPPEPLPAGVFWRALDLIREIPVSELAELMTGCECVLHLANLTKQSPDADRRAAQGLAHAAIVAGVKDFFYASSIRVYGSAFGRIDELTPARPHRADIYGQNKLRQERELRQTFEGSATRLRVLRIGHVLSDTSTSRPPSSLSFRYLLFWGRTYPHYIGARDAARAIAYLVQAHDRLHQMIYNVTREIGRSDTFNRRFAAKLPTWQGTLCRWLSLPPILPYLLWRRPQEASNTRAAVILERGLEAERWAYGDDRE